MSEPIIKIENLSKSFHVGTGEVSVLKDISFEINAGDFLIIFGPSGCGKSTLLHSILGLEEPTKGNVYFSGKSLYDGTTEDDRSEFRKTHVGMVYQQPNWIRSLNVLENMAFPLLLLGKERKIAFDKAKIILEVVEMIDWAEYIPTELSSGQQQRISLARALITNPEVIIADEPTGNLDFESGQELMEILADLNKMQNKTIVMVTHDMEYFKFAKRAVRMLDGSIAEAYEGEEDKNGLLAKIKTKRVSREQ